MNQDEFRNYHAAMLQKAFKLFELEPPDPPATEAQLSKMESGVGVRLPESFKAFLAEYGGGSFGSTNVFSAETDSEYSLLSRFHEALPLCGEELIPFSDDFCGGWYGYRKDGKKVLEDIVDWNTDGGLQSTDYDSIFDFVAKHAYGMA